MNKRVKSPKKLHLSLDTIRHLEKPQLELVAGGATIISCNGSCPEYWTCPAC